MRGNLVAPGRFDCGHHPQATLSSPHRRVSQEKPPQVLPSSMKAPQSAMLLKELPYPQKDNRCLEDYEILDLHRLRTRSSLFLRKLQPKP